MANPSNLKKNLNGNLESNSEIYRAQIYRQPNFDSKFWEICVLEEVKNTVITYCIFVL